MKNKILGILMLIIPLLTFNTITAMAQTHFYRGRYMNTGDILYTFDKGFVYRGRYTNTSDILFTYNGIIPLPVILLML